MKYLPYIILAIVLPVLLFTYIIALGYTPWVNAFLVLPAETEILLFTIQAGIGAAAIGHFFGCRKTIKNKGSISVNKTSNPKNKVNFKYLALFIIMVSIFIIPFILNSNADFGGTDGQGPEEIEQRGYTPWINPLGYEPDEFGERALFSLQVALGSGFIGYFVGYTTKRKVDEKIE